LDADKGTIWTTCQDNGLLSLKFTNGVWPFPESSTPPGKQNLYQRACWLTLRGIPESRGS